MNIKDAQGDGSVKQAIIAADNYYAGFGPGTVNVFRNILGLPEAKWQDVEMEEEDQQDWGQAYDLSQRTLSDFLN